MAPEQKRGEVATEATDIYAVGLIMDRCLEAPLPDELAEVRDQALAKDPAERWVPAATREALDAAVEGA